MSSDRGYVRHGSGLLIRMMSPVENPIIPRPRFSLFGLILKITHRWRTKWMVKIYLWEVLLCAPLSHITVSSIFKKDSICAVFASVPYHSIHSFACDYISSVSKKNPLLFTHLDTTHWKIESQIITIIRKRYYLSLLLLTGNYTRWAMIYE